MFLDYTIRKNKKSKTIGYINSILFDVKFGNLKREEQKKILNVIKDLHLVKQDIKDIAVDIDPETEKGKKRLRELEQAVTHIRFALQLLWRFPPEIKYHDFTDFPHCTCPILDNKERIGMENKIIHKNCPIHGINNTETEKNSLTADIKDDKIKTMI